MAVTDLLTTTMCLFGWLLVGAPQGALCDASDSNYCPDGDVRLVGGSSDNEGRVELCQNNEWGTICGQTLNDNFAKVVCHQLGYTTKDATAYCRANHYGQGQGPIWLNNVVCDDNSSLIHCTSTLRPTYCDHSDDAGVSCGSKRHGSTYCWKADHKTSTIIYSTVFGVSGTILFVSIPLIIMLKVFLRKRHNNRRMIRITQAAGDGTGLVTYRPLQQSDPGAPSIADPVNVIPGNQPPKVASSDSYSTPMPSMQFQQTSGDQFKVPHNVLPPSSESNCPLVAVGTNQMGQIEGSPLPAADETEVDDKAPLITIIMTANEDGNSH